jgi:hypothetical protein
VPRKSRLTDPEFAKQVAEAYLEGWDRATMAEHFECHIDTISGWTQDPRVQVHITSGAKARENRIRRVIDREIEGRLTGAAIEKIPLDLLLKLRKELSGRGGKADEDETGAASVDAWDALDKNPELARQLNESMEK